MAKQRFKGFQCGMSFRRLKKVLKQQEHEDKGYDGTDDPVEQHVNKYIEGRAL